jgi:signal transduction histidine kinase
LTNALKHGGGRTVSASVRRIDDNLVVDVTNPLRDDLAARRGSGESTARNGLAGMRERASMFSGSLRAGRSHGRFEVHAVLPLADGRTAVLDGVS